jgi:predicted  nucleic acid-binding Zn-ribbon protein
MPVKCSECGKILVVDPSVEAPKECQWCGSSKRTYVIEIANTMTFIEALRIIFYVIKIKLRLR